MHLTVQNGDACTQGAYLKPSKCQLIVPAEPEAKDDVLRYAGKRAKEDGTFAFAHLAPGKYLLPARAIPATEPADKPATWNVTERTKLRQKAEAVKAHIELKSCQRVGNFTLRWGQ